MKLEDICHFISLPIISEKRGNLVVAEGEQLGFFQIRRLFFIYDVQPGEMRGNHANKNTEFFLIENTKPPAMLGRME